ncbi:MAG: hypothetical protein HC804_01180 [Anaerolineae bacterium]|nr:hypothetical protein [Anaerolineae bacterium]
MNCGFKVYRREVVESVRLYSDLHRFTPVLATWQGYRVTELPWRTMPAMPGSPNMAAGAPHGA